MQKSEKDRLSANYEKLRLALLDLTRRNQLLNYNLSQRSRRHLQMVGVSLEGIRELLVGDEASIRINALPAPKENLDEEKTRQFRSALQRMKATDEDYLQKITKLEASGNNDEIEFEKLERVLRDQVREKLGLPPRISKKQLNRSEHAKSLDIDPSFDLPIKSKKGPDGLYTLKFEEELDPLLTKIAADAVLAEQEMGLSTLYLAFGFLEWYESASSDKRAYAPLLLLPVTLTKVRAHGRITYTISAREGDLEHNLSLQKLLQQNYSNRFIPDFTSPDEDKLAKISDYYSVIEKAVSGLERWKIKPWLVLGHFAFGRFSMYSDLTPENWGDVTEHALVGPLLKGTERQTDNVAGPSIPQDYNIDEPEYENIAPYLIQDADASQHSALIDVMKNKNLVIQGPPGTGKSQTITNIIANTLAAGKKVLFLAEKQAALDVVKRRLDRAGLGDFCLELHSDKSSPKAVIESLKKRADLGFNQHVSFNLKADLAWENARLAMNEYASALNSTEFGSKSAFQLFWKSIRNQSLLRNYWPIIENLRIPNVSINEEALHQLNTKIDLYRQLEEDYETTFGEWQSSIWHHANLAVETDGDCREVISALSALKSVLDDLSALQDENSNYVGEQFSRLEDLVDILGDVNLQPRSNDIAFVTAMSVEKSKEVLTKAQNFLELVLELSAYEDADVLSDTLLSECVNFEKLPGNRNYLEFTPAEVLNDVSTMVSRARDLSDVADQVLTALASLEVPDNASIGAVSTVVEALLELHTLDARQRSIYLKSRSQSVSSLQKLLETQSDLLDEKKYWENNLAHKEFLTRENLSKLRASIGVLSSNLFKRMAFSVSGKIKETRDFLTTLGFEEGMKVQQIQKLVEFLDRYYEFIEQAAGQIIFGDHWLGLETPIAEFIAAQKKHSQLMKSIRKFSEINVSAVLFETIDHRVLTDDQLKVFQRFLENANSIKSDVSPSIAELRNDLLGKIEGERKTSSQLSSSCCELVKLPIRRARYIFQLRQKKHALIEGLSGIALFGEECRNVNETMLQNISRAVCWIEAVDQSKVTLSLKETLKTASAPRQFNELKRYVEETRTCKLDSEIHISKLSKFSLTDFEFQLFGENKKRAGELLRAKDELVPLTRIKKIRYELNALGFGSIIEKIEKAGVPPKDLAAVINAAIIKKDAEAVRTQSDQLDTNGVRLAKHRATFIDRDRIKMQTHQSFIRAKLLTNIPPAGKAFGPKKTWTGYSLLQNEFVKSKRFASVRTIIGGAGDAIQEMKPCFMMSPLSLAKFAPKQSVSFDVLVIDEASQMRPEDALGGMLRCGQIVVVGDPKQLPPTDFFSRSDATLNQDEDDDSDEIDSESILEACESVFNERRRLKWHYRSQCESLIAFSNQFFYENSLITFPMSKPDSFSIELVRVDGLFQSSCNPLEALAIAQQAIIFMRRHANDPIERIPSLGLVALNIQQKEYIEEEMNRLAAGDESIDRYRDKCQEKGEDFFIKNLENVQGDERDQIFISLTYGKNKKTTQLHQNFGPINKKQGHRRLNVLFTRARVRIGLFASFGSSDVRIQETSSDGVRALKQYLEFVETKGRSAVKSIGVDADSDFELEVADRLQRKGYQVQLQIGVSGFKIDLGVRHPDFPEHFLAGVECDGASYHSSKSARDRDRLREEILSKLGWDLVRVWSTDWFDNPDRETDKLVSQLEKLRSAKDFSAKQYDPLDFEGVDAEEVELADVDHSDSSGHPNVGLADLETYKIANLLESFDPVAADFYQANYVKKLSEMVQHVVEIEGPLHLDLLFDRVARAHGFERTGPKVRAVVKGAMAKSLRVEQEPDGREVVYPIGLKKGSLVPFRADANSGREHTDIPMVELASLAAPYLKLKMSDEVVIRKLADFFSLGRLRESTRKRFMDVVGIAKRNV